MKIIAIINNYSAEKCNQNAPLDYFLLPDSAILNAGKPFFLPPFDQEFKVYPSLIIKISRLGKNIAPKFAPRYYNEAAVGLNVRAEKTLSRLRQNNLPWTPATAFDGAAIMGNFFSKEIINTDNFQFEVMQNQNPATQWKISQMRQNIDNTISEISQKMMLKIGDLIYVAFPDNGININIDDNITINSQDTQLLNIKIK